MVHYISVSCLFGHYPSSLFLNKITTFQRLALSPSSDDKKGTDTYFCMSSLAIVLLPSQVKVQNREEDSFLGCSAV
jgi:hypothetical protein